MPTAAPSLLSPLWQMPPLAPGGMLGGMDPMELARQAALMRGPLTMAQAGNDEMDRIDAAWLRDLRNKPTPPSSPGPAAPQQPEVADPAASKNLGGLYGMLAEDPDVAYRASLLPLVRTHEGGIRLGMPQAALDLARGAVDLLAGPETGVMTPQATGALASLAGSSAFQAPQPGVLAAIKAYHGSPHRFDRFDMSKIGTGEGAQAYGYGLYFAESPNVAKGYQKNLSAMPKHTKVTAGDSQFTPSTTAETLARNAVQQSGNDPEALKLWFEETKALAGGQNARFTVEDVAEAERLAGNLQANNSGALYHTTLAPDHEDLLDYDLPLAQQSQKVKDALKTFGIDPDGKHKDWTGAQAYESSRLVPGDYRDPKAASAALRAAGIPGLRYLDAGSRGQGEGSRNIVLFDDSLVQIDRVE